MRQKFTSSKVNKENQTCNVNKKANDCQKYAIWYNNQILFYNISKWHDQQEDFFFSSSLHPYFPCHICLSVNPLIQNMLNYHQNIWQLICKLKYILTYNFGQQRKIPYVHHIWIFFTSCKPNSQTCINLSKPNSKPTFQGQLFTPHRGCYSLILELKGRFSH